MPILGSGHPQADVFLLKYAPTASEIEEGVAFYGRSGTAIMKSLRRLDIDPLRSTGRCASSAPCPTPRWPRRSASRGWSRSSRSCSRDRRRDGPGGARALNELALPLAQESHDRPGEFQPLTPSIEALYTPDIDGALDEESAKRAFWSAFRLLGDWYADFPPY